MYILPRMWYILIRMEKPSNTEKTTLSQTIADTEEVRFRYEVAGESIPSICQDLKIFVRDLEALVHQEGWLQAVSPGPTASEEDVNTYYKNGRMRLTTLMTRRAIKLFPALMKIEDSVVEAIEDTLDGYDSGRDGASQDLARIVNAYSKLLDKQALLHEAIATPALADKKIEQLLKASALSQVLDQLDGKGRVLPSEDTSA